MSWIFATLLLLSGAAESSTSFREYNCESSSEFDRVIVTFRARSGEARTLRFLGTEKAVLVEAKELYGILDWQYIRAIHLRSSEEGGETLLSIEYVQRNGDVGMFEGGYLRAECLRDILSRFDSRIRFIRSSRSKPAGISRGA